MTTYAERTTVPVERSRAEIEKVLKKYGATAFLYAWDPENSREVIGFAIAGLTVRIHLPIPLREDYSVPRLTKAAGQAAWEQACRSRWRALLLVVKAKLEAVASNITTLEKEFLPDTVLPGGETVYEWAAPQLRVFVQRGEMPPMLPGPARKALE